MMKCHTKTIADIRDMYENGQIELDPPYQRKPAWKTKQRRLLLASLFNGIPIPALIFHRHFLHNNTKKVNKEYENILEKFWEYPIPIIEYEGDLTDIFGRNVASKDVFVRINSTGSPLKKQEIRHALWSGFFFELGSFLEKKYKKLFLNWKIISKADIDRYLFHEFILELCTACFEGNYSDRRKKLDELLSQHNWNKKEITKTQKHFTKVILWIKDIFPDDSIRVTRFKNKSDFYSLFVLLLKLAQK